MISTKGRYAVRFMLDLAQQGTDSPVTLDGVASRQNISKKYLEIVVKMLVQGKLVKGTSGKGGGYRLVRSADKYTIGEILEMTEGTLATVACLNKDAEPCPRAGECITLPMWKKFDSIAYNYFYGITLKDLMEGKV